MANYLSRDGHDSPGGSSHRPPSAAVAELETASILDLDPPIVPTGNNNATRAFGTTYGNNGTPTQSVSERRRSSSSSSEGMFASLQSQKRNSLDPNMTSRRASWKEQTKEGGLFSKIWDSYVKGN